MNILHPTVKLEALSIPVENKKGTITVPCINKNGELRPNILERLIESAGRTCYKSENRISEGSAERFCKMIQNRNHMSVLEHCSATFRIICDRGVTHEIVRHRIASYSQESTRYCNYATNKEIAFIEPEWVLSDEHLHTELNIACSVPAKNKYTIDNLRKTAKEEIISDSSLDTLTKQLLLFLKACTDAEWYYNKLIELGQTPQQARAVLPNALKTELVMTANFREWLHFLELRTSTAAHPDMRIIANMIAKNLSQVSSTLFGKFCI